MSSSGQATVEAAILIPVLLLMLLILTQPAILLYNRIVMENAAAQSCRLLSTRSDVGAYSADKYRGYVQRRLAAIPPVDIFHVHQGANSWDIVMEGNESSGEVTVRITNKVRPLPLLGWAEGLLGLLDGQGYLTQTVEATMPTQPAWVWQNGTGPTDWTTRWK
jgi:hypothetical protein